MERIRRIFKNFKDNIELSFDGAKESIFEERLVDES